MSCQPPAGGPALLGCCPGAVEVTTVRSVFVVSDTDLYDATAEEDAFIRITDKLVEADLSVCPQGQQLYAYWQRYPLEDWSPNLVVLGSWDFTSGAVTFNGHYPRRTFPGEETTGRGEKYIVDGTDDVCQVIEIKPYNQAWQQIACSMVSPGVEFTLLPTKNQNQMRHTLYSSNYPDCCNEAP